jgi:hypothetical protein
MMMGVVAQDDRSRLIRMKPKPPSGAATVLAQVNLEARALQHEDQQVGDRVVVFNDQCAKGGQGQQRRRDGGGIAGHGYTVSWQYCPVEAAFQSTEHPPNSGFVPEREEDARCAVPCLLTNPVRNRP